MRLRSLVPVALLAAALPATAFAHGGSYAPPVTGQPGNPQVPPGTADAPGGTTRWETWWAANKEYFLRLGEQMREDDGPVSEGLGGKKPRVSAAAARETRDAAAPAALVPLFVEALADESFEVRTAAAIALGKTGDADGGKALREA